MDEIGQDPSREFGSPRKKPMKLEDGAPVKLEDGAPEDEELVCMKLVGMLLFYLLLKFHGDQHE